MTRQGMHRTSGLSSSSKSQVTPPTLSSKAWKEQLRAIYYQPNRSQEECRRVLRQMVLLRRSVSIVTPGATKIQNEASMQEEAVSMTNENDAMECSFTNDDELFEILWDELEEDGDWEPLYQEIVQAQQQEELEWMQQQILDYQEQQQNP